MPKHTQRLNVFLLVLLTFTAAQTAVQDRLAPDLRIRIEDAVSKFMTTSVAPGVAVAVVLNGERAWSAGFGMADLENNVAVTPQTLFRLASVSKPITATGAMHLWEQGKLDLDAPIQKYCSAFPQKEWPITTRQLLGHLGGIRHYNPDGKGDVPEDSARHFSTMQESLPLFAGDPLVAKPGTEFHYSTYGYTLIGCVF